MLSFKKKILQSLNYSKGMYDENFQSYHWKYQNRKKKNLYNIENLDNFRNNNLSNGLDDQFYSKEETNNFFSSLMKDHGKDFISKMLEDKNIGNVKECYKYEDKYFSSNELFHIKHLEKIKNYLNLNSNNIVCEIGPGYGSFISKFLKIFNSKIILIDLPEANFLNSFFLKSIFPEKNFFLTSDIQNQQIEKKNILENDIIIICPWDKLPNLKVDLFINSRSMMEMNKESINYYFKYIQKSLVKNGYFLCINRYYKDTVGYPIELHNYPFDKNWSVIISEASWFQDHVHFFFLKRVGENSGNIFEELKKIKHISNIKVKQDPRLIRRIMPSNIYRIYKKIKFFFFKK